MKRHLEDNEQLERFKEAAVTTDYILSSSKIHKKGSNSFFLLVFLRSNIKEIFLNHIHPELINSDFRACFKEHSYKLTHTCIHS